MPIVEVYGVGKYGVVKDIAPHLLPAEAWTDGNNVRFTLEVVKRTEGRTQIFDPPPVIPAFIMGTQSAVEFLWLYTSLSKAYAIQGVSHVDITRVSGDYTASLAREWNGVVFQGIPIVNNGIDVPQQWATISTATKLTDLPNWPAAKRAKVIRAFKSFLIGLNITESSVNKPHRVLWSAAADPGTVPVTWDIADPTREAGQVDLSDINAGFLRDGGSVGDAFALYKDESTWIMRFIGGQSIFSQHQVSSSSGILAARCWTPVLHGQGHFVATSEDLVVFNGQEIKSLIDKRWKKFIFNDIDPVQFQNSFCFTNRLLDEAYFVYPSLGATAPNRALIWNYNYNTLVAKDWVGSSVGSGVIETPAVDVWSGVAGSWGENSQFWSQLSRRQNIITDGSIAKLYQLDLGDTYNGTVFTAFVERVGLAVTGKDAEGNPKADIKSRKLVRKIWPKVTGGKVNVKVGSQEDLTGPIVWGPSQLFDPSTQKFLDVTTNGRLIAVRFESTSTERWQLEGYDLDMTILGVY